METSDPCHHPLGLKNLSFASRTAATVTFLPGNSLDIHPAFVLGLLLVAKIDCVAVFAVDFAVETIVESRRV